MFQEHPEHHSLIGQVVSCAAQRIADQDRQLKALKEAADRSKPEQELYARMRAFANDSVSLCCL